MNFGLNFLIWSQFVDSTKSKKKLPKNDILKIIKSIILSWCRPNIFIWDSKPVICLVLLLPVLLLLIFQKVIREFKQDSNFKSKYCFLCKLWKSQSIVSAEGIACEEAATSSCVSYYFFPIVSCCISGGAIAIMILTIWTAEIIIFHWSTSKYPIQKQKLLILIKKLCNGVTRSKYVELNIW